MTTKFHIEAVKYAISGRKSLKLNDIQKIFGHNEALAFYTYGAAMAQWEHFNKFIDYCKSDPEFQAKIFNSIWLYDPNAGVHAEMKIIL